jgi:hypothetical protein
MTAAHLRIPAGRDDLEEAFAAEIQPGSVEAGLVFVAAGPEIGDAWPVVLDELTEAFDLTQAATRAGGPVVYVVAGEDLLGQRGPGAAMIACGLLSGARTLAFETRKAGIPANVVATDGHTSLDALATWVRRLLEPGGPTGELVRLGGNHLGKALP